MYKWTKGIATWKVKNTLYISVPFTWLMDKANKIASKHKGKVLIGGPGTMKPSYCEGFEPILFHNPCATFTTRGCPNKCGFCIVPEIEGKFKELKNFRPAPIICDNNFLAANVKHIEKVIEVIKCYPIVDFQGIDSNFVTPEKADLLGKLHCKLHMGFDHRNESKVFDAVNLLKKRSSKSITCYVIIGYNDTPDEAKYRLNLVRSWGVLPFPMRYQPLTTKKKNSYISPNWDETELKKMMRYYSRLTWTGKVPYEEFDNNYSRKKDK